MRNRIKLKSRLVGSSKTRFSRIMLEGTKVHKNIVTKEVKYVGFDKKIAYKEKLPSRSLASRENIILSRFINLQKRYS